MSRHNEPPHRIRGFRGVRDAAASRPVCGILSPAFGERFISFPPFTMGQYFRAVNKTKQEVVCPWCLGGGSKLWEWAANPLGAVFTLLLRRSNGGGGGDFYGYGPQILEMDPAAPEKTFQAIAKGVAMEGKPIQPDPDSVVGRWAGDEVYLVGDYDSSKLFEESFGYRNISRQLAETWNNFIEIEDKQLKYSPECRCETHAEATV